MAIANFNLEKRKDKSGNVIMKNVPIRLSFFCNGKRLEYYTQERVTNAENVLFRDKTFVRVKANEPQAGRINKKLTVLKRAVESLYDDAIALKQKPTVDYLRQKLDEQFKGKSTDPNQKLVKDAFNDYLQYTIKEKAANTLKAKKATEGHFSNYVNKKYGKLLFEDITDDLAEGFRDYLIEQGQVNNTVVKYTRSFNGFINWSKDKPRRYLTADIKIKGAENDIDIIYLNQGEVDHLMTIPMPTLSLERVRDVFVFNCFVGMRYGDLNNLKKVDVNEHQITFYISKGNETVSQIVPLVDQSRRILDKYSSLPGETALPCLSNVNMNKYIKEVMEHADFNEIITVATMKGNGKIIKKQYKKWELITTHTSRKTFITIAVSLGIPETIIKSITGHSKNSRAFAKYYVVSEEVKQGAMSVFNNKQGSLK